MSRRLASAAVPLLGAGLVLLLAGAAPLLWGHDLAGLVLLAALFVLHAAVSVCLRTPVRPAASLRGGLGCVSGRREARALVSAGRPQVHNPGPVPVARPGIT